MKFTNFNVIWKQGWASSSLKGTSSKFQFQVEKKNSFRGTRSGSKKGTWNFTFQVPSSFCSEIRKKVYRFWTALNEFNLPNLPKNHLSQSKRDYIWIFSRAGISKFTTPLNKGNSPCFFVYFKLLFIN